MLSIHPAELSGVYRAIPSKSFAHRAMICAALAKGRSSLYPVQASDDVKATMGALAQLGLADVSLCGDAVTVGGGLRLPRQTVFCNESGSTLRFLLPVSLLLGGADFIGRGRLMQRPLGPFEALVQDKGWAFEKDGDRLSLRGTLMPGEYAVSGDVSSQYVSGLLLALPLCGESVVCLTTPLESEGYVDITLQVMASFGICVRQEGGKYFMPAGEYVPLEYEIEGDYSAAAFFLAMAALGADIGVCGLKPDSVQGDRAILDILGQLGRGVRWENGEIRVDTFGEMGGGEIDISQVPDLLPVLAVLACGACGETAFVKGARLRYKESDRLTSTAALINGLGGRAEELPDGLVVRGNGRLSGGSVDAFGDHRIAMAAAVAALICEQEIRLGGAECVAKSAPNFWQEYEGLGGRIG
ncbi:MAG: 3-phosphoshikimate 1-carboxyvinyltransferase [Christensenellales bacterium]|jgi:3-phosphoshikimate 1-carboxyvinyltransferase